MNKKKTALYLLFLCFVTINFMAYLQSSKMIHYSTSGVRTEKPENMGFFRKVLVLFTGVNLPKPVNSTTPKDWGLEFKNVTYPTDDGLLLSAWYVPHAHSKAMVILFHGHAASKSQLLLEAKAFYDQGYDLFLVDLRGSGDSNGYESSFGYWESNDVKVSVQYVREHWPKEKIVLFGQSMGSAAILRAFARYSIQADAVILGCPFDDFFNTVRNRFSIMGLPSFPLAQLLMFWGSVQLGFSGFDFQPSKDAQAVHCPALLLYGEKDRNVLPSESVTVLKGLAGVKKAEDFLDCGHESFLKKGPEQWKKGVHRFLGQALR